MPVLTICGELFSDNLGDGVIADCLAHLVRRQDPDLAVRHLDLSIKEGYGERVLPVIRPRATLRGFRSRLFDVTPLLAKQVIKRIWFRRRVEPMMRSFFRSRLAGSDALMIGGGQLLMDNGLHFPLKIRTLVRTARELGIEPIFYFGCGARSEWSAMGRAIMREALEGEDIVQIITRDKESADHLRANFPGLRTPISTGGDTALWVREAYAGVLGASDQGAQAEKPVGLGIMDPLLMRGMVRRAKDVADERMIAFWVDLIRRLTDARWPVVLFTNGAADDELFAARVREALGRRHPDLSDTRILPRAQEPATLIRHIASCRAIVACRLHAAVIAYAMSVPGIGIIWDTKTVQFGRHTGRSRFFVEPEALDAEHIHKLLEEAMDVGVPAEQQTKVKGAVDESLRALLARSGLLPSSPGS